MGVREIVRSLEQSQMGINALPRRMILAPPPRERWYAILLLAQGLTATAEALERSPYHRQVGVSLRRGRACSPDIRADQGFPPPLTKRSRRS